MLEDTRKTNVEGKKYFRSMLMRGKDTFTGYPFVSNAKLQTANPEIGKILDIGWRRVRLCAFETAMDCSYYGHRQCIDDARTQALVAIYKGAEDIFVRYGLTLIKCVVSATNNKIVKPNHQL